MTISCYFRELISPEGSGYLAEFARRIKVLGVATFTPVYLFLRQCYAFRNRCSDRIKLLIYDRTGFWLLMKRLEQDRFAWPRRSQAVLELTAEQLHWLLDGIDLEAVRRHPVRQYQHVA